MLLSAIDALLAATFDTASTASGPATQRGWIHAAVQDAVGRAKWRKVRRELGPTVALTGEYELDEDIRQVVSLRVGGSRPWLRASIEDVWQYDAANARLLGAPGMFTDYYETVVQDGAVADGDSSLVTLRPIPTVSALAIDALCAVLPPVIDVSSLGTVVIPVPEDLARPIAYNGAAALGFVESLGRADLAAPHAAKFEAAVQELSRRANSRVGRGPVRLRPQRPR